MTKDELIATAKAAGLGDHQDFVASSPVFANYMERLGRFASLAVAAEREACAKLCEQAGAAMAWGVAHEIRKRSNALGQRGAEGASAAPTGCASNDGSENNLQNSNGNAAGGQGE